MKPFWHEDSLSASEDERHMAAALYLLQRAIAMRAATEPQWPTIHASLRDAAWHVEEARKYWTRDRMLEARELIENVFPETRNNQSTNSL